MKPLRIACIIALFSVLTGSIGLAYAAPIKAPQADGWIPLVPPGSASATFTYGPEGRSPHAAGFRIPHSGGAPGEWTFKIVPQDNQAAYSYWYGPIIDNEPFAGEMFRTTSDCGQAFEGHGAGYPPLVAEGDDYGVMVYANFDKCGEAGRNATSSFTIEWVLVSAPAEPSGPTDTPTPTDTPEGPSCDIAFTPDTREVSPGDTVDILLEVIAPDGSGEAWTDVMYWVDEGPGQITGGMTTDGDGNLFLTYQAPADFGGADEAVIAAQVPGCPQAVTTVLSLEQSQGPSPVQQPPTDTPTPTATPEGDSTLTLEIEDDWKGVAADGVSELVIIARLTGALVGQEILWSVENLEDGSNLEGTLLVDSKTPDVWRVSFKPPEDLIYPYVAGITAYVAGATDIAGAGSEELSIEVRVVRPPVVLIHGVWSDQSSMGDMEKFLKNSGQFEVTERVNYGSTSGDGVVINVPALEQGINHAKAELWKLGIDVERVDVVAHSMGGLITRYFMEVGTGSGPQAHQVRKLVTLATPHLGSPLADWYTNLVTNGMQNCPNPNGYDDNLVTQGEIDWFMKLLRTIEQMKEYALKYGQSVVDLHTQGKPGSLKNVLNFSHWQAHNVLYTIRGDEPIIAQGSVASLKSKDFPAPLGMYPFDTKNPGKCKQEKASTAVENMIGQLVDYLAMVGTDGVVPLASAGGSSLGIPHQTITVHANHFTITSNSIAMTYTLCALLGHQPSLDFLTWVSSQSPGSLHVYDASGKHVGLDINGLPEIGIEGALYEPFSDALGDHEFIMVPQTEGVRVVFEADEEGTVGLDIAQFLEDGMHVFNYENVAVEPGTTISIEVDPSEPAGKIEQANGTIESLAPTYQILSPVAVGVSGGGSRPVAEIGALDYLIVGGLALFILSLVAIVVVLLISRKRAGARKALFALVPLLLISMVGTVIFSLQGDEEPQAPVVTMEPLTIWETASPDESWPEQAEAQPAVTPTPSASEPTTATPQPPEAPPFEISTQIYTHPDQLFELTPPEGWTVSLIEGGSVFVEPDGEGQITILANNTGQVLDAESFTRFVEASELNGWAGLEGFTELEREIDGANGVASIAKSFTFEGQRYTVVSIYKHFEASVYGYDFWALERDYMRYGPLYDTLMESLSLYYDNAAALPLYHDRYTFQNISGLYQIDVPISWHVQYDEADTAQIDTLFSPDEHAVLQNIAYDDGHIVSKSESGQMALNLLNAYYAQDIIITEDVVMTDGSERLTWYSPGSAYQGQSFFETRGTTFLLLTMMFDDPYADFYLPLMGELISTYQVP
jgi:pimeloyl-ACP methyl ester carboxylesterase